MAKDIFESYPASQTNGGKRAYCGGVTVAKPLPYDPPVGPKGIMDKGVGLGGTNHGNCGTQGKR